METSLLTALISASSAIIVAGVSYYLTKRREREVEWRKLKLEHYQKYIAALSAVVGSLSSRETQAAYAEAANSLQLVAPEAVLLALYAFQEAIRYDNGASVESHDEALTKLMQAMRSDVHSAMSSGKQVTFRLFDVPPTSTAS